MNYERPARAGFSDGRQADSNDEIRAAYEDGRGKLTLRAKVHIEDGAAGRKLIVITEVPYQIPKAAMLEKILKLSEERKVRRRASRRHLRYPRRIRPHGSARGNRAQAGRRSDGDSVGAL
ncbi:MAG: DNA gyrase subunit A [Christensenellales bacterium]